MNFHYCEVERDDWAEYGPGLLGKLNYVKQKMREYNIYKPSIISETSVCEGQRAGQTTYTDEMQAAYIHKFAARVLAAHELVDANWWPTDIPDYADCGFYYANHLCSQIAVGI